MIMLFCSRPATQAVFEDRQEARQRASMDNVCLPALPGPQPSQKWHETAVSIDERAQKDLDKPDSNNSHHQGNRHAARSSATFDLQTITR